MPMEIGDLVSVTLRGRVFNQKVMTSYGFRVMNVNNTGDTRASQLALATVISNDTGTTLLGTYLAAVSPALILDEIWAQRIRPIRMRKTVLAVALQGSNGTNLASPNVAAVVTRKSDLGGRSSISNLHLPGVPVDGTNLLSGEWQSTMLTKLEAHAHESYDTITVVNGGETITYKGCIINTPGGPVDHQLITAHQVNRYQRTMRRRTVGLGE